MTEYFIKSILSEILFESRLCESAEEQNIVNYLYTNLLLEKILYGEPISVPELRQLLRQKIVDFEFIKIGAGKHPESKGELRKARGTTMLKYIPEKDRPKGKRPSYPSVAAFWEIKPENGDPGHWRSVSVKSKEIILNKDEKTGKPLVKIIDKPKGADQETEKEKEIPTKTPIEKPVQKPIGQPLTKPLIQKPRIYHFFNKVTGATIDFNYYYDEAVEKLKELGQNWSFTTKNLSRTNNLPNMMAKDASAEQPINNAPFALMGEPGKVPDVAKPKLKTPVVDNGLFTWMPDDEDVLDWSDIENVPTDEELLNAENQNAEADQENKLKK